jgi:hypothetical protein
LSDVGLPVIAILQSKTSARGILLGIIDRPANAPDDWVPVAPAPPRYPVATPAPLLEYSPGLLCGCGERFDQHATGAATVCLDPECNCAEFAPDLPGTGAVHQAYNDDGAGYDNLPVAGAELDDDEAREEALDRAEAAADADRNDWRTRPEFTTAFGFNVGNIVLVCTCGHNAGGHGGGDRTCFVQCPCVGFRVDVERTIMYPPNARWLRVAPPAVQALARPTPEEVEYRAARDEWGLLKKITAATKNVPEAAPPIKITPVEVADSVELRDAYERFGLLELDDRPAKGKKS